MGSQNPPEQHQQETCQRSLHHWQRKTLQMNCKNMQQAPKTHWTFFNGEAHDIMHETVWIALDDKIFKCKGFADMNRNNHGQVNLGLVNRQAVCRHAAAV